MLSTKKLLFRILSRMNSNGFVSSVDLSSYTSTNYTFQTDGYLAVSCGASSTAKAIVRVYDRTAGTSFVIGGWGNGTFMSHALFVKKGMQARVLTLEAGGTVYFHAFSTI